jgi:hypothetical protein
MRRILDFNAGSSRMKISVFETAADRSYRLGAHRERSKPSSVRHGLPVQCAPSDRDHASAIAASHDRFAAHRGALDHIRDRIVQGGLGYMAATTRYLVNLDAHLFVYRINCERLALRGAGRV